MGLPMVADNLLPLKTEFNGKKRYVKKWSTKPINAHNAPAAAMANINFCLESLSRKIPRQLRNINIPDTKDGIANSPDHNCEKNDKYGLLPKIAANTIDDASIINGLSREDCNLPAIPRVSDMTSNTAIPIPPDNNSNNRRGVSMLLYKNGTSGRIYARMTAKAANINRYKPTTFHLSTTSGNSTAIFGSKRFFIKS